jgi:hypothetical protein
MCKITCRNCNHAGYYFDNYGFIKFTENQLKEIYDNSNFPSNKGKDYPSIYSAPLCENNKWKSELISDGVLNPENINIALSEMTKNRLFCYLYYLIKDWIKKNWKIITEIVSFMAAIGTILLIVLTIIKH